MQEPIVCINLWKTDYREGELHHRLGGIGQIFVVDGESAEVLEPGEREHDKPLFLKRLKFCRAFVWPEHELHDPSAFFHHPVTKRAPVSAVGKILLQARELVSLLLDSLRRTLWFSCSHLSLCRTSRRDARSWRCGNRLSTGCSHPHGPRPYRKWRAGFLLYPRPHPRR